MDFTPNNIQYPWFNKGENRGSFMNSYVGRDGNRENASMKNELFRLYEDLLTLRESTHDCIYFCVGGKEIHFENNNISYDVGSAFRQFPNFLREFNNPLVVLVDTYEDTDPFAFKFLAIDEHIVERNENFVVWRYEDIYDPSIKSVNITIKIYRTYFPSFVESGTLFDRRQDKQFVTCFYDRFKSLLQGINNKDNIDCKIIFANTATFKYKQGTGEESGNVNMVMFKEVLEFVEMKNFLLLIWPYGSSYFYGFGSRTRINYTRDSLFDTNAVNCIQDVTNSKNLRLLDIYLTMLNFKKKEI